jgi:YesN/AraC family two-component response regulator
MVLTDVVMPEVNGRELYEALSAELPELRVLYMSGYTDDVIAHHGIIEEGVHLLPKPFTMAALTSKIREVLDEDQT